MRILKWASITFLLILIIAYFIGGYIARYLVINGLEYIEPELASYGIVLKHFHYGDVQLRSPNSFSIKRVDIEFDLEKEFYGKKSFTAEFNSGIVIVRLSKFRDPALKFSLRDFNLYIQPNEDNPNRPFGKFENASWSGEIPLRLYDPRESGELILEKLKTLFNENSIPDEVNFKGDAILNLDGQDIRISMYTERKDRRTFLFFNKDDLLAAADNFENFNLSEEEAQLLSQYPARTLHILKITRDAQRISEKEKSKQSDFPDDALKHVYWSYHLTRTFGPDFSKEITDAHETMPNNTPEQRKMDFHNNEMGRMLASESLSVNDLRDYVLNSKDVIRFPEEIQ
jgi:hypothetical protein